MTIVNKILLQILLGSTDTQIQLIKICSMAAIRNKICVLYCNILFHYSEGIVHYQ